MVFVSFHNIKEISVDNINELASGSYCFHIRIRNDQGLHEISFFSNEYKKLLIKGKDI